MSKTTKQNAVTIVPTIFHTAEPELTGDPVTRKCVFTAELLGQWLVAVGFEHEDTMSEKQVVLLIEDETVIRIDIALALEEAGFEVLEAPDGARALELFDSGPERISSVITDIRLGHGANGWDVARHCRQTNPVLPVVYMSGDSAGDWAAQGVPGSVMIVKPFALAQILTAVSTLLNDLGPKLASS